MSKDEDKDEDLSFKDKLRHGAFSTLFSAELLRQPKYFYRKERIL